MLPPLTVLFVDDDPYIRKILCAYLQQCGFEVLCAADGRDAIDAARQFEGDIDILVSDVNMPSMDGTQLAVELTRIRPRIKVLLISAYADTTAAIHPDWQFLPKPFPPAALYERIRAICDADPPPELARAPVDLLRHRMREARAEYVRYSQEYDLLLAVSGDVALAAPDRKIALRQAAKIRKSTLHGYADAVRQFSEFLRGPQPGL
jgi:DNA-binding response OmpR family regulator